MLLTCNTKASKASFDKRVFKKEGNGVNARVARNVDNNRITLCHSFFVLDSLDILPPPPYSANGFTWSRCSLLGPLELTYRTNILQDPL